MTLFWRARTNKYLHFWIPGMNFSSWNWEKKIHHHHHGVSLLWAIASLRTFLHSSPPIARSHHTFTPVVRRSFNRSLDLIIRRMEINIDWLNRNDEPAKEGKKNFKWISAEAKKTGLEWVGNAASMKTVDLENRYMYMLLGNTYAHTHARSHTQYA